METEIIVVASTGRRGLLRISETGADDGGLVHPPGVGMDELFHQAAVLAHRHAWLTLGGADVQLPQLTWRIEKLLPTDPGMENVQGGSAYGAFAMAILMIYANSPLVRRILGFGGQLMTDGVRRELQTPLRSLVGSKALIRRVAVTAEGDGATGDFRPVAFDGIDKKFESLVDLQKSPDPGERLKACVVARGQKFPAGILTVPIVQAYSAIDAFQRLFEGGLL